jgi:hypothetical protein
MRFFNLAHFPKKLKIFLGTIWNSYSVFFPKEKKSKKIIVTLNFSWQKYNQSVNAQKCYRKISKKIIEFFILK